MHAFGKPFERARNRSVTLHLHPVVARAMAGQAAVEALLPFAAVAFGMVLAALVTAWAI